MPVQARLSTARIWCHESEDSIVAVIPQMQKGTIFKQVRLLGTAHFPDAIGGPGDHHQRHQVNKQPVFHHPHARR